MSSIDFVILIKTFSIERSSHAGGERYCLHSRTVFVRTIEFDLRPIAFTEITRQRGTLSMDESVINTPPHTLPQTVLEIYFLNFGHKLSPPNDAANIMMLFTDGEATAGPVTHWPTIRDHFTERNKVNFLK